MASRGDINIDTVQPKLFNNWKKLNIEETLDKAGLFTKLKSSQYFDNGKFPVIDQGDKFISGYVNDESLLYKGALPVIIFGDHTRNIKFVDFPFAAGADGTKILKPLEIYNPKFYHYYLKSLQVPNLGYSRHFSILKEIEFPLPPLAEQNRIVAKLDSLFAQFESIKTSMAKIPILLKNFRQQILTQAVTGNILPFKHSEFLKLKDLGVWKGGGTPSKAVIDYWQNGTVLWITAKDMKGLFLSDSMDKITEHAVENSSAILIPKNSILIVTRSGILRRILPISSNIVETTVNQDLKVLIPNDRVNYKFLLYSLRGLEEDIRNTCMKSGTTVESIEFPLLKEYEINLPSLQEQKEIVSRIESLFAKADAIEEKYKNLKAKIETLPQTILHKAFKGELTDQLETDGDAKDLLEEIVAFKNSEKLKKVIRNL